MRAIVLLVLALAVAPALAPALPAVGAGAALVDAPALVDATLVVESTSYGALTTINGFSGEPNIAAGPDGTVYVTGLGWDGARGTLVFRRLPGETGFSYLGLPNPGLGGRDEAIAIGPDGDVWVAGMYRPAGAADNCISATGSSDRGSTWGPTVPGLCDLDQGVDRQWITVDGDGNPWVVVHEICCSGQHTAYRSTDDGVTFQLVSATALNAGFPGNAFTDRAAGRIYEATNCNAPGLTTRLGPCVLIGTTGENPSPVWVESLVARYVVAPVGLAHVAGAVDDAGNVYVTWIDKALTELRHGVYLARSTDGGLTWSTPARVSDASRLGTMPWVAAGSAGNVAVVWYETTTATSDPNLAPASTTWHVKSAIVRDWTSATMPPPIVTQLSTASVKSGPICTTGASCSGNRELLDFFEATVGPTGTLHVVWPETGTWVLRVADVDADLR